MVSGLVDYVNLPGIIATLVGSRVATLYELQTVYGVEDAYNLLEVLAVDRFNDNLVREHGNSN